MSEAKEDVLQQIEEAWKSARKQLEELRSAVERTGQMAELKVHGEFLNRDLDRAFREFGAAVWAQSQKGKLQLPPSVSAEVRAVEEAEARQAAHKRAINDILDEGAEVAGKLRAEKKTQSSKKTLAAKGKKL